MVFNGVRHVFTQTIVTGVVAAHDALQFREFAHHVREQIGFGQLRGGVDGLHKRCVIGLRQQGRNAFGNGTHAVGAVALGAKFVVIHHLGQTFHARGECLFAVLVEEEFGIGQTWAHHALIAANHRRSVIGGDVADHQKLIGELACCVEQGKVFLVGLHREDEALLWHIEELLVKLAHQDVGAFDQGGHFI